MEFVKGDLVEVCSKEEGFLGSYFKAKILSKFIHGKFYKVKYKTLLTEDESQPLIEMISADEIRPFPPKFPVEEFQIHDVIDAFDKDGWWIGEITGKRGDFYSVHFEISNEDLEYPKEKLRKHLEWYQRNWMYYDT